MALCKIPWILIRYRVFLRAFISTAKSIRDPKSFNEHYKEFSRPYLC